MLQGTGIYTDKSHPMLIVIVPNNQLNYLMKIISTEDPTAFVYVTEAYEVLGRGQRPVGEDGTEQHAQPRASPLREQPAGVHGEVGCGDAIEERCETHHWHGNQFF